MMVNWQVERLALYGFNMFRTTREANATLNTALQMSTYSNLQANWQENMFSILLAPGYMLDVHAAVNVKLIRSRTSSTASQLDFASMQVTSHQVV